MEKRDVKRVAWKTCFQHTKHQAVSKCWMVSDGISVYVRTNPCWVSSHFFCPGELLTPHVPLPCSPSPFHVMFTESSTKNIGSNMFHPDFRVFLGKFLCSNPPQKKHVLPGDIVNPSHQSGMFTVFFQYVSTCVHALSICYPYVTLW